VYWRPSKFALALFFNIVKLTHKKPGRKRMFERSGKKVAAQGRWPRLAGGAAIALAMLGRGALGARV
jgi:hypothetical protein